MYEEADTRAEMIAPVHKEQSQEATFLEISDILEKKLVSLPHLCHYPSGFGLRTSKRSDLCFPAMLGVELAQKHKSVGGALICKARYCNWPSQLCNKVRTSGVAKCAFELRFSTTI
jgi:hypothetical protein